MTLNRQTRRAVFGAVTAGALVTGATVLVSCASTVASIGSAAADGALTAIVTRVQAVVSALGVAAAVAGTNLSADAQTAIARMNQAATSVGALIATGAAAVAGAVNSTGLAGLITTAGTVLLGILRLIPGLGTVVEIVQDALAVAPTIIGFASVILNPGKTTAPTAAMFYDGGAARRLGVIT